LIKLVVPHEVVAYHVMWFLVLLSAQVIGSAAGEYPEHCRYTGRRCQPGTRSRGSWSSADGRGTTQATCWTPTWAPTPADRSPPTVPGCSNCATHGGHQNQPTLRHTGLVSYGAQELTELTLRPAVRPVPLTDGWPPSSAPAALALTSHREAGCPARTE
jgi:hypothetical protein